MAIDIHLGYMKLKETDTDRILGYYRNNYEWHKIQGDTPQEFVNKLKNTMKIGNDKIIFHNNHLKYFERLTPMPKTIDDATYEEIKNLTEKTTYLLVLDKKSA
jgi:hypothetical protein